MMRSPIPAPVSAGRRASIWSGPAACITADAELGMVVIDQVRRSRASEQLRPLFEPPQLRLLPPDLLEQLGLLGLFLLFVLGLVAPGKQLTGANEELPLLLAHLDRMDGIVGGDLLDRLAAADRLHGEPGLELGTVSALFVPLLWRRIRQ
jgi:hypothetical protein